MKHIKLVLLIAATGIITSCSSDIFNSGELEIEDRIINEDYDGVNIDGAIDLYVVQGQDYDLRVEAGSRKMKFISTEVSNGILYIEEENNNVSNDKQTKVYISKEFLNQIHLDGSGDVQALDLETDHMDLKIHGSGDMELELEGTQTLEIDIDGSGDISLEGNAGTAIWNIDGSGDIDGRDFPVEDAFINIEGSGDIFVNVSNLLDVTIEGSGDVLYLGSPNVINTDISGSGSVEPY